MNRYILNKLKLSEAEIEMFKPLLKFVGLLVALLIVLLVAQFELNVMASFVSKFI